MSARETYGQHGHRYQIVQNSGNSRVHMGDQIANVHYDIANANGLTFSYFTLVL